MLLPRNRKKGLYPITMEQLLLKYNGSVPRYTSYPTAPHFSPAISQGHYRQWLAALPADAPLSLYIHIPYCKKLCWFCGCNMEVSHREAQIDAYVTVLIKEIEKIKRCLNARRLVSHLHFGGGSPTILSSDTFIRLMDVLRENFVLEDAEEIAIEVDPRNVDEKKIEAYAAAGINRVSLGVQDYNEEVQRAVNRIQPYTLVHDVVAQFRHHGIHALNIDLMYGLPKQTIAHVLENISLSLTLAPDRFALFGYAHVPWLKKHMALIKDNELPLAEERIAMFQAALNALQMAEYQPIGLDHFAKATDPMAIALQQKTLRRNFQGYTTDKADILLGFGTSAISALPMGYVQNITDTALYQSYIEQGILPVAKGIAISEEDKLRRRVIESLMCYFEVDMVALALQYGKTENYFLPEITKLKPFQEEGLVHIKDNRCLSLNPEARQIVRVVSSIFDTYFIQQEERHSKVA